ncbi:hypothetical protein M422DRAFT_777200 [Sphaerobolus stellatus SS14]|nr:hypothetical protein M422DRAFT_777200 [Sphaerobolus stellatus SS14]
MPAFVPQICLFALSLLPLPSLNHLSRHIYRLTPSIATSGSFTYLLHRHRCLYSFYLQLPSYLICTATNRKPSTSSVRPKPPSAPSTPIHQSFAHIDDVPRHNRLRRRNPRASLLLRLRLLSLSSSSPRSPVEMIFDDDEEHERRNGRRRRS